MSTENEISKTVHSKDTSDNLIFLSVNVQKGRYRGAQIPKRQDLIYVWIFGMENADTIKIFLDIKTVFRCYNNIILC
jgi:hypothetical protein